MGLCRFGVDEEGRDFWPCGLRKIVSTIALILKERAHSHRADVVVVKKEECETLNLNDDDRVTEIDRMKKGADGSQVTSNHSSTKSLNSFGQSKGRPAAGTLIVCLTSVLRQWHDELHKKYTMEAIEQRMGGDGGRVGGSHGAGSAHGGEIEKYCGGRGGFCRKDFGRGDFRSPPPRAYEYSDKYNGDYNKGESGYEMPRRTRSYGDMSETGAEKEGKRRRQRRR
ncbi:hypothetical protein NC652_000982 [Populus alba x Populus x berolinensis]|nr:hypothetical protein NC652_000982 [Populus alba x Populus x berolinensis]